MYRVVVIDDEMIIRVGFGSFIDWAAEGFEVVGEAADGDEGLQLCRKVQPHVIFTDIGMSRMDGLTFIKKAVQEFPQAKIVILSCMDDFLVIQQALRLGVHDYFLKISFSPAQLIQFMRKMKAELDAQTQQTEGKTSGSELSAFLTLQNSYRSSLENGIPLGELPASSRLSREALSNSRMVLFLISRDNDAYPFADEAYGSRPPLIAVLDEMFSKICKCDIVEINTGTILVVGDDFYETSREKILRYMREVQDTLFRMLHCSVSIGLNLSIRSLAQLPEAYRSLTRLQDERFYQGEKTIMLDESPVRVFAEGDKEMSWGKLSDQIAEALEIYQFDTAPRYLEEQLDRVREARNQSRRSVLDGVMLSLVQYERLAQRFLGDEERSAQSIQGIVNACMTLESLRRKALDYMRGIQEQVEKQMRSVGTNQDIIKAKQYIREHLDDCSAKALAEHLCFNYSYFCNLFKRETGMNFLDYLLQERMRYAAKLHQTTTLSMDKIAQRVGYTDVNHFKKLLANYEKTNGEQGGK